MLKTTDREFIDDITLRPCPGCTKLMLFARNRKTGANGPIDPRAGVYVVYQPKPGDTEVECDTATVFLRERVAKIVMTDGTELLPHQLSIAVSHFSTCPSRDKLIAQWRKAGGGA